MDSYGEALKLGQKADNHDLGPADVAHLTKSELICVLAALNRPAANKSAAVQVLQGQLLAALKEGARLAPLFPKPATKLCVKGSEVLSLSPSLLLVLAARKCSAPNHVTLMLAFTSLSLPLQDDESSSEEEEDAESPAESPVSCCAPCSRSAVGAKDTVSKRNLCPFQGSKVVTSLSWFRGAWYGMDGKSVKKDLSSARRSPKSRHSFWECCHKLVSTPEACPGDREGGL